MRRLIAATGISALFLVTACGDSEPIAVPDLAGMQGDAARTALSDANLGHSYETEDGNVWNASNWVVDRTVPEAGTEVEPDTEVALHLVRPETDDPDDEDLEEGVGDESGIEAGEDEPQDIEDPVSQFDIEHDESDLGGAVPGGTTFVRFDIADNFTQGMIASGAERATCDALEEGLAAHPDTGRIAIEGSFPTMDAYGNEEDSVILRAHYDAATLSQINFENCYIIDIWDARDGGQLHPDLIQ